MPKKQEIKILDPPHPEGIFLSIELHSPGCWLGIRQGLLETSGSWQGHEGPEKKCKIEGVWISEMAAIWEGALCFSLVSRDQQFPCCSPSVSSSGY